MKYLKINEQLELLKNKRFDELIAYAKEHNLNPVSYTHLTLPTTMLV